MLKPRVLHVEIDEVDLIKRLLALREQGKIGVVYAEEGRFWISSNPFDLYGSRERYPLQKLMELVISLEPAVKKPVAPQGMPVAYFMKKA